MPTWFPPRRRVFPPLKATDTRARKVETNKGQRESRTLETRPASPESLAFPFAAQAARLRRQRKDRKVELVALITDLGPGELTPTQWLLANRQAWGIENGSHQRLDISLNDDRCRVREPNGQWILGMMRRLVISLFMHWRTRRRKNKQRTLTDFQAEMGEDNLAKAFRVLTSARPAW